MNYNIEITDNFKKEAKRLVKKDKSIIFGMIETMLTKKKLKDFFQKNVAAL